MQEIISIDSWLRMLATELEEKEFPRGYGPQLRHAAEILKNAEAQIFAIDNANIQLNQQMKTTAKEAADIHKEAMILWARYQKAVEIISRYEPKTAISMAEYRPKLPNAV